ncbi:MAG TPA: bacillithiol biosynthesis deacetylase BshB1 [Sphingobacteriaceae bacterium]|nr:bacillithiol biosynthesis deacetylase BshB1 [Sphingobacteriaceae bacterium]
MKLDTLVFAAHPDDAELSCSGTILKQIEAGKKVGVIDLTRGELGTRGSADQRGDEAEVSKNILGLHIRENLRMRDGFFINDEEHQLQIITVLRKYKPHIVLCNALCDRHPDHSEGSDLVIKSAFLSGLNKIETRVNDVVQEAWRPPLVFQYIQDTYIKPDILIDITDVWDKKMDSIRAFKTQFFNPEDIKSDATYISSPDFLNIVESRARELGKNIGAKYAEGFTSKKLLGVNDLFNLK